jgi:DNA integrity scanning protein DisA with diadenylate cyclase activity
MSIYTDENDEFFDDLRKYCENNKLNLSEHTSKSDHRNYFGNRFMSDSDKKIQSEKMKKLFKEGKHNFQIFRPQKTEEQLKNLSEKMKGNNYGSLRIMTDELKQKLSEKSKGNTNVRNTKWWHNNITGERKRCINSPGKEWSNNFHVVLSPEGKKRIVETSSRPKTKEHIEKLKIAAKNRPSNSKGTIWVINDEGKRKRVKPNEIPKGYFNVKEKR